MEGRFGPPDSTFMLERPLDPQALDMGPAHGHSQVTPCQGPGWSLAVPETHQGGASSAGFSVHSPQPWPRVRGPKLPCKSLVLYLCTNAWPGLEFNIQMLLEPGPWLQSLVTQTRRQVGTQLKSGRAWSLVILPGGKASQSCGGGGSRFLFSQGHWGLRAGPGREQAQGWTELSWMLTAQGT